MLRARIIAHRARARKRQTQTSVQASALVVLCLKRLQQERCCRIIWQVKLVSYGVVMFCPYCGTAEQSPKSYCRRCGEWLADLSSKPQQRMKVMMVFNALNSFMALFAAVILYSTYLGTPEIKWSVYVGAALCSVIAVHQMISFRLCTRAQAEIAAH
jgi:hypothetical protein